MPEQRNNYPYNGQNHPTQGQGQIYRQPMQNPQGYNGQNRPTQGQIPVRAPIRQVQKRPAGHRNIRTPRRHRRPTPFVFIMIIFVIILLIVIFTSKSFKRFIDGIDDTTEITTEDIADNKKTDSNIESTYVDTTPETEEDPTVLPPEDDEFLIFIDPGHGFGDVGASSELLGSYDEKDINLMVALEVYNQLKNSGYNVMLTHDGETFPVSPIDDGDNLFYIDERVSYVNSKKVDLFVSIHCDSFTSSTTYGTRIYYCNNYKFSDEAAVLAETLQRSINETFSNYKDALLFPKSRTEAYYVTCETDAPAVLIELGFITNESDVACMLDENWRSNMGFAIANAISVYLYENNTEE